MANITGASLTPIYNRLNGTENYHPYDAQTFADWSLEAGDTVKVSRGSENYKSPVHSTKMTWRGTPMITLNSTGKQERDSISKVSKNKYRRSGYGRRNNRTDNGLWHKIEETDEYWRSYYNDEINGLYSVVEQTAEYWRASLTDTKNGLYSRIEQTAEYWRASLTDTKNGLYSRIEQTAEYWRASLTDAENGLESLVEQTAAYWRSTLTDTENRLQTSIEQTASGWRVALSGVMSNGKVTAASIATAINNQGQAGVKLSGDWIAIDGNTTLTGALSLSGGDFTLNGNLYVGLSGANYVQATTLKLVGASSSQGANIQNLGATDVQDMIIKAEVSGNTLRLWKHGDSTAGDPSLTFSKATTLSGAWSGRNYTVTAKQGTTTVGTKTGIVYDGLVPTGEVSKSGKNVSRDFIVYSDDGEGDADTIIMTQTATINADEVYDDGYASAHLSGSWDKTSSTLTNNNRITITKVSTGSLNSLNYIISAAASIAYNSTTNKFVATGQAKVDGTQRGDNATASSGEITIQFNNLQSSGASAYRTISVKNGSTVIRTSGNLTDYGDGYTAGNSAGQTTGYNSAHLSGTWSKTSSSLTNNNKITISKVTTGSSNSLNYVISAAASIAYNSSTNKFVATGKAKVDGTQRGDNATASSGEITIQFDNIQGSGASAYRTISVKNGSTVIRTSGNLTDYGDGYSSGYDSGWDAVGGNEVSLGSSGSASGAITKGVSKFEGYIWVKNHSGTWVRKRSFEISTGATHYTTTLYYYSGGSYHSIPKNTLCYTDS